MKTLSLFATLVVASFSAGDVLAYTTRTTVTKYLAPEAGSFRLSYDATAHTAKLCVDKKNFVFQLSYDAVQQSLYNLACTHEAGGGPYCHFVTQDYGCPRTPSNHPCLIRNNVPSRCFTIPLTEQEYTDAEWGMAALFTRLPDVEGVLRKDPAKGVAVRA
ncbi:uncharacterized protein PSFLO_05639 [Pseudozyma flocculosa]|uniref:Uncharacterized protein n=1 Tax=Pseudozyma flocculosa TaxID=84751 RepID=A0A5C3F8V8_9BASI|nr:uncharacterized protein PSFLO_05639 [Pseudozyma flocculosa]